MYGMSCVKGDSSAGPVDAYLRLGVRVCVTCCVIGQWPVNVEESVLYRLDKTAV